MTDRKCLICGKEIYNETCIPLQIAYNIPNEGLYMTINLYCKECNDTVVQPTIREISDKLKLGYKVGLKEDS